MIGQRRDGVDGQRVDGFTVAPRRGTAVEVGDGEGFLVGVRSRGSSVRRCNKGVILSIGVFLGLDAVDKHFGLEHEAAQGVLQERLQHVDVFVQLLFEVGDALFETVDSLVQVGERRVQAVDLLLQVLVGSGISLFQAVDVGAEVVDLAGHDGHGVVNILFEVGLLLLQILLQLGDVGQRLLDVLVGSALPFVEDVERGLLSRQGTVDARDVGLSLHHVVRERLDRLFQTAEDVGQVALDAVELLGQGFELRLVLVGRGRSGFGSSLRLAGQVVGLVGLGLGVGDGQLQLGVAFAEAVGRFLQSLFQLLAGVLHQGACAFKRGGVAIGYEPLSLLNGGGEILVGRLQVGNLGFDRRNPAVD